MSLDAKLASTSLRAKLAAFDDAALEGLASKGVVRRARRDLDAGRATIVEHDRTAATIDADGQRVSIDERGPAAARCDCPAGGVCRHIVLAVMALLRDERTAGDGVHAESDAESDAEQSDFESQPDFASEPDSVSASSFASGSDSESNAGAGASVIEELCAMRQAELEKFAGAGWAAALALAADEASFAVVERGVNAVVALHEPKAEVTFIAGQGLAGAAYKGPKTRRRSVIAACALRLRLRAGIGVELGDSALAGAALGNSAPGDPALGGFEPGSPALGRRVEASTAVAQLDPRRFVAAARDAIEHGVPAVLPGRSATAADAFLDLAISTRTGSLPRLAAELRRLSRHASLAAAHDAAFDAEAFLIDASRTFALTRALDADPRDPRLTGRIRREYAAADPLDLWMLGAARWRSAAGARGLTAYGFSPGTRRWHAAHQGRAAGTDPSFDPMTAYHAPLWGAGALHTLIGRTLHLDAPSIADDGSIAPTLPGPASAGPSVPPLPDLVDAGAAADDFTALRRDLATRAGVGLRRSAVPLPALIVPTSFGRIAFRDLDQVYEWEIADRHGATLTLELHGDDDKIAERLPALARRIRAILVEAALPARGLSVMPVTLFVDDGPAMRIVNLGFDELPRPDVVGKTLERVRGVLSAHGDAEAGVAARAGANPADSIETVVSAALDAAAAVVERSTRPDLERIVGACEGCGLMTLASAARRLHSADDVVSALWTAYVASEARAAIRLGG